MIVLGIDSSDDFVSVGLASADGVIVSIVSGVEARNKNEVHSLINSTLDVSKISMARIEGVAVAIGPGSFTGLRVGLAAAKGLCWTLNLPLVGVSSLSGLLGCLENEWSKVLMVKDAKRNEFYYGGFEKKDGAISQTIPDSVRSADEIADLISGGYLIAGPGVGAFSKRKGACSTMEMIGFDRQRAGGEIARRGREMLLSGARLDLRSAAPVYLRTPGFRTVGQ